MSTATKTWRSITAQELADVIASQGPVDIIDVRTPTEFREVHIEGARNVPLDRLQPADLVAGREADRPLYVVCRSGSRAAKACDAIFRSGFTSVVHVEGGTEVWRSPGSRTVVQWE